MSKFRLMENEYLKVAVQDSGAELSSIYDKEKKQEVIWEAKALWPRHAPLLFPFIGELYQKEYCYEGNIYPMTAHGFARDSQFELVYYNEHQTIHKLLSSKETLEKYPFLFEVEVTHTLKGRQVVVEWKVINKDEKDLLFSIGGHPAIRVPVVEAEEQKDYYLSFGERTQLNYMQITSNGGTVINDIIHTLQIPNHKYRIGEHLFDRGVLIFEKYSVDEVSLHRPNGDKYVTLHCNDFPYVGVWTKPGAPFICLEPWYGRADDDGFTGELEKKEGIQRIFPKDVFYAQHAIEVH